ncbi:hypothetical protein O7635_21680 [Asanoa sp. WMMD1127]|uniref:hypothetical protein n=1 Tax=Asanoa sp. WMMD1127 TaxID=3016107 RepID=UPI0024164057|nr:hypothetical protein [Asanoa sp. WMMD1127]MDG4824470.1 hypothetical protein [Asanoa sp. WMMD1127]
MDPQPNRPRAGTPSPRWARRVFLVLAVLFTIGALSALTHPWWAGEVTWWRFAQGAGWTVMAAASVWHLRRTRRDDGG